MFESKANPLDRIIQSSWQCLKPSSEFRTEENVIQCPGRLFVDSHT